MLRTAAAGLAGIARDTLARVLLIEDSQTDAHIIQKLLDTRDRRFELEHVSYLAAGLAVLENGGVDLVLADLTLPDSHGMETVETLLMRAPEVPLVVLTGLADEALASRAVRSGAQDYLVKGEVDGPLLARSLRYAIERKSFESALQRSRHRLQALFDHALDAIFMVDDQGRCVAANPAAEELTGYSRDELTELGMAELTRAADHGSGEDLWKDFVGTGKQRGEHVLRRKDGTDVQVAYRAVAHVQPGLHLSFLEDLSTRRRAEEESRHQAERLRLTMKQLPAVLWTTDRDLRFTSAMGDGLADIRPEAWKNASVYELWSGPEADPKPADAHLRAIQGEPVSYVAEYLGRCFQAHVEPFRDSRGDIVGVIGVGLDITDRHLAEAALRETEQQLRASQKMEAVGRLAGGVAHDFNNLVTAITGYSELLLSRLAPEAPGRHELEEIRRAGDRAADLTRQLLAFSRSQVMRPTVLDLNEVVAGTRSMLQRLLGEDVRLITSLAPRAVRTKADRGQLEQVILNLAVNARDAMPRGGELTLETSLVELDDSWARKGVVIEPGPYALLAVTDSGEGMPPEVVERVFEPFFTTKEPGKGTGLGLSTAYGIVKQSGGYVFAYSEVGEGTTFRVYLPRAEAGEDPRSPDQPVPPGEGRGETVLVVEDEDAVRSLIVQILRLRGYSVLQAESGQKALALCREGRTIDLVVTDVVMPDMRGPELGKILTSIVPGLPLLFISGYPGTAIVRRGEISRDTPFLQKPFTQDELIGKIRDLLDRSIA